MLKGIATLVTFFCACNLPYAQAPRFQLSTGASININNFQWSIAGNVQGQSPDILSELKFQTITSAGVFLNGLYRPIKNVTIQASYQKNGTVSGSVIDIDYDGDNRTGIVYKERFSSSKGYLETISTGATYNIVVKEKYKLKAGIDYTSTTQNYYLHRPAIEKLQTTYRSTWNGPGLSAGGDYYINKSFSAHAFLVYYFITYKAEANWNLRREFEHPVSFVQNAKGNMMAGKLDVVFRLNSVVSLMVNGTIGRSTTQKGFDIAYLTNDTQPVTRFNGACRNNGEARIGMAVNF
jgi:hypothetical protein